VPDSSMDIKAKNLQIMLQAAANEDSAKRPKTTLPKHDIKYNYVNSDDINTLEILELITKAFSGDDLLRLEYEGPLYKQLKTIIKNRPITFLNIRNYIRAIKEDINKHKIILDRIEDLLRDIEAAQASEETEQFDEYTDIPDGLFKKFMSVLNGKKNISKSKFSKKKTNSVANLRATKEVLKKWLAGQYDDLEAASKGIKGLRGKIRQIIKQKHPELEEWLDKLTTTELLCLATLNKYFKINPSHNFIREAKVCKTLSNQGLGIFKIEGRLIDECGKALQRGQSYGNLKKQHLERRLQREQQKPMEPTLGDF